MTTQLVLGPPEILWLDDPNFEHWTGRTPRTILRDFHPAGLAVYERNGRKFILHSEYIAFLKATSKKKELITHDGSEPGHDHSHRFRRGAGGRISAVAAGQ